uniref:Bm8276 n=1 Tax=Brugia malayi TaxID=6279 RepID=A0A0J9YCJ5_BRUMA|nr:Bm8276 [Brugia malayi]
MSVDCQMKPTQLVECEQIRKMKNEEGRITDKPKVPITRAELLPSNEYTEATYNVFHYRLRTRNCILQTKLPMPYLRLKRSIFQLGRAEPPPEEQGKYLPEPFDAAAFQFKGPLIIEYPKLHILEHDLTNAKPTGSSVKDHVQFDENLNVILEYLISIMLASDRNMA